MVVEADSSGGVIAVRYGLGRTPGLLTVGVQSETIGRVLIDDVSQRLPGGVPVVVGPETPSHMLAARQFVDVLTGSGRSTEFGVDLLVDVGRVGASAEEVSWLTRADAVVVVGEANAERLPAAADLCMRLDRTSTPVVMVLRGGGAAQLVGSDLGRMPIIEVPEDRAGAAQLEGKLFRRPFWQRPRDTLLSTAQVLAEELQSVGGASSQNV